MTLATIRNGIFHILTACGPWAAAEVSTCDFGVLEGTAGCAIVFLPGRDTRIEPDRLGSTLNQRNYHRYWNVIGQLYIKDVGDPQRLLSLVWQGHDDLYSTLSKDDSLNSSACAAGLTHLSFNPESAVEAAGAYWAVVEFGLTAEEF